MLTRSRNKLNQLHQLADNGFPIPMEMWLIQQSVNQLNVSLESCAEEYFGFGFQPLIVAIVGFRPSKFGDYYSSRAHNYQQRREDDASIEQRTQTIKLMLQHGCNPYWYAFFVPPTGFLTPLFSAVKVGFAAVIPLSWLSLKHAWNHHMLVIKIPFFFQQD